MRCAPIWEERYLRWIAGDRKRQINISKQGPDSVADWAGNVPGSETDAGILAFTYMPNFSRIRWGEEALLSENGLLFFFLPTKAIVAFFVLTTSGFLTPDVAMAHVPKSRMSSYALINQNAHNVRSMVYHIIKGVARWELAVTNKMNPLQPRAKASLISVLTKFIWWIHHPR